VVNYARFFETIEAHKELLLETERYLWKNPEPGYREWKTHAWLKKHFEALGYELHEAGDIPGFYTDIDTGRPGPRVAVFGEMDAITVPDHPERDPETNVAHACGHHFQCAALLGIAIALKAEGALDGLCGSIRLIAVPCEEGVRREFFEEKRAQGILHYIGGKKEFIYRGYLDGVDMAIMVHGCSKGFGMNQGSNGRISKRFTFIGKASHAASAWDGQNALYAATNAISSANALRETFREKDTIRFHSIITKGGEVVNVIPNEVVVESSVRGFTVPAIVEANDKINRAFAAGAATMNCRLIIDDMFGYSPRKEDPRLQAAFLEVARELFEESEIRLINNHETGCTDMGDVSTIMPICHATVGGGRGAGHTAEYVAEDPYTGCVKNAKLQTGVLALLLSNNAKRAKEVIAQKEVLYKSRQEYVEALDKFTFCGDAVIYNEDGTITLRTKK